MKKFVLLTLQVLLVSAFHPVFAQGPFTPINWLDFSGNAGASFPYDMSENPFDKKVVHAMRIPDQMNMQLSTMGLDDLKTLWDRLDEEKFISNAVRLDQYDPYDLDGQGGGTFGASYKVCFNSENLYVMLKYIDKQGLGVKDYGDDSRYFEISMQTREYNRYEAGFQAAQEVYGLNGKNAQYARYIELGGSKYALWPGGIRENVSNCGQTGEWKNALGADKTNESMWVKEADGTIWAGIAFNFKDHMLYMKDEWGPYSSSNYVPFDPYVKDTISFDVSSGLRLDDTNVMHYWSSTTNDAFEMLYFSGYLVFDLEARVPRPVVKSPVYYCPGEPPLPLEVTGTNLLWYTSSSGGTGSVEPPVPVTATPGVYSYFVSQSDGGIESDRAEIKVYVTALEPQFTGDTLVSCKSEASFTAGSNYQGTSDVSYSWAFNDQVYEGDHFSTGAVTGEEHVLLKAQTATGCAGEENIHVSLVPSGNPLLLQLVTVDPETGKNRLVWEIPEDFSADSLYVMRSVDGGNPSLLDALGFNQALTSYIDLNSDPALTSYAYQVKVKDECGIFSDPGTIQQSLHLDAFQNMDATLDLLWNAYQGREVARYRVYKGLTPESLTLTGNTIPEVHSSIDHVSLDPVYYQVEAQFWNYTGNPDLGASRSNIFHFSDPLLQVIDTVIVTVYDTIRIETCTGKSDTLKINTNLGVGGDALNNINVYPNPTTENIIIDLGDYSHFSMHTLRIIDGTGRTIFSQVCNLPRYEVNIKEFGNKGMYYLQFVSPQNVVLDTRIIVLQ